MRCGFLHDIEYKTLFFNLKTNIQVILSSYKNLKDKYGVF